MSLERLRLLTCVRVPMAISRAPVTAPQKTTSTARHRGQPSRKEVYWGIQLATSGIDRTGATDVSPSNHSTSIPASIPRRARGRHFFSGRYRSLNAITTAGYPSWTFPKPFLFNDPQAVSFDSNAVLRHQFGTIPNAPGRVPRPRLAPPPTIGSRNRNRWAFQRCATSPTSDVRLVVPHIRLTRS